MTNCERARLDAMDGKDVGPHLQECRDCAEFAGDVTRIRSLLRSGSGGLPPSLKKEIIKAGRTRSAVPSVFWRRYLVAAAAAVLLVALTLVTVHPRSGAAWGVVRESRGAAPEGRIFAPAVLSTGADGLASIELADGSRLKLNTGTTLIVDASGWNWRLDAGEVWGQANPKAQRPPIEIATETGLARITGTEFNLRASKSRTLLAVRRGRVELSNRLGRISVTDKQQAQATQDTAPRATRLVNDERVFAWARQLKGVKRHPMEKPFLDDEAGSSEGAAGSLDAGDAKISLQRHTIDVDIQDDIASVTVDQTFFNPTPRRLEGRFRFPLPKDASVSRFAMTISDDKLMEGRIVEKQRARQIYESIVRRMEDPGLLEWQEGSQFSARIFPIEPNREKRIVIAYQQALARRDGRVQFVMPLVSDALTENPPKNFLLRVHVKSRDEISRFESPSHHVDVARRDAHELRAAAEGNDYVPLNDLVINYSASPGPEVSALKQGDYFLLRVRPEFRGAAAAGPRTLVFWLDVSHSTTPSLREIQYNLLERLLSKLQPEDKFNIFVSDITGRYLYPSPQGFDKREDALAKVWGFETGGATDLGAALAGLKAAPGLTIVYIGDGVPTLGVQDTAELVRSYAASPADEFFAFALGNNVNDMLLEGFALTKSGAVFHLTPGENLARKASEFAWALSRPMLKGLEPKVEGAADVYPKKFASLLQGEEVIIVGRKTADKLTAFGRPVDMGTAMENPYLARLAAQRKVRDLLVADGKKEEIIKLSEKYTIMTPYTSLLVLESEEEFKKYNIEATPKVPKQEPKGSEGKELNRWRESEVLEDRAKKVTDALGENDEKKDGRFFSSDREERDLQLAEAGRTVASESPRSLLPSATPKPEAVPTPRPATVPEPSMPPPPQPRPVSPAPVHGAPFGPLELKKVVVPESRKEELARLASSLGIEPAHAADLAAAAGSVGKLIKIVETTSDAQLQREALRMLEVLLLGSAPVDRGAALEGLQTLLRFKPRLTEGWIRLGTLIDAAGDTAAAWRAITTIVEVAPEDPQARLRLAELMLQRGLGQQARVELAEVTRRRPEEPEAYLRLADLAAQDGVLAEAEAGYRRILRYNFDHRFGDVEGRARQGLLAVYRRMSGPGVAEKIKRLESGRLEFKDVKIVLTWKTAKTDVDLWVTAPGEEKCSYQQKSTFRGGKLDRDVTDGFGPETYTMPEFREGRWLVQVHYYSAHGAGVTPGQVEIVLFEGTEREVRKVFPFVLKTEKQELKIFEGPLSSIR